MKSHLRLLGLLVMVAFLAAACREPAVVPVAPPAASPVPSPTSAPPPTPSPTPDDGRLALVITTSVGRQVDVRAESAVDPQQRSRGLMYREHLPEGEGMLFVFPADTTASFWMQNTPLPLSIAFIAADGAIVGLADMEPLSTQTHGSPRPYRYALEVPGGFFARNGIQAGDVVRYRSGAGTRPLAEMPANREAR